MHRFRTITQWPELNWPELNGLPEAENNFTI
jgi:hypothetical protein